MNNKTFWIGFVVVYVVLQALGFVIHVVMMADAYEAAAAIFRPEAEMNDMMWMMMLSAAVTVYMFCYIFTRGYEGKGIMEGVRYGALVSFMMAGAWSIDVHVIFPVPADMASIWLLSGFASFMIAGAIFAAIYKPQGAASA